MAATPFTHAWRRGALPASAMVHGLSGVRLPGLPGLIGDASCSLYLFHPYVLKVFNKVFHVFDTPGLLAYVMTPVSIALCCVVTICIYRWVELPMTHWLRGIFINRKKVVTQPQILPVSSGE